MISTQVDFRYVQNDRLPVIQATLLAADGVTPIDLTTATSITLVMRQANGSDPAVGGPCTIVGSHVNGVVQYALQAADTASAGMYHLEFIIVFSGGLPMTVPNGDPKTMYIRPHI